jgi:hypothetical protein
MYGSAEVTYAICPFALLGRRDLERMDQRWAIRNSRVAQGWVRYERD